MNGDAALDFDFGALGVRHRRHRDLVSALDEPFAERKHVALLAADHWRVELREHEYAHQRSTALVWDSHTSR